MFTLEGIRHFKASEILNGKDVPGSLLQNIIPTVMVLDELREYYGKPIYINSTYRSPEYNKAVGGKPNSLHVQFNAIDFTIADKADLEDLYKRLNMWDYSYNFKFLPKYGSMGIGFYSNRFIHLDTRATLNMNAPARWQG